MTGILVPIGQRLWCQKSIHFTPIINTGSITQQYFLFFYKTPLLQNISAFWEASHKSYFIRELFLIYRTQNYGTWDWVNSVCNKINRPDFRETNQSY